MVLLVTAGCADRENARNSGRMRHTRQTTAMGASPADEAAIDVETDAEPLGPTGRAVDLRINGESLRVVRPSAQNPWVVGGSEYDAGPIPSYLIAHGEGGPELENGKSAPVDVIRRVPQLLSLSVGDPDGVGDILGYYVEFEGYEGHFFVPVQPDSEVIGAEREDGGRIEIGFFLDEVFPPGQERDSQ